MLTKGLQPFNSSSAADSSSGQQATAAAAAATATAMATRAQFENSNEIGVFSKLTNSYALCSIGGSENFYSVFESELADHIPVVHTSIAGCRFVGRVCVGEEPGGESGVRPLLRCAASFAWSASLALVRVVCRGSGSAAKCYIPGVDVPYTSSPCEYLVRTLWYDTPLVVNRMFTARLVHFLHRIG